MDTNYKRHKFGIASALTDMITMVMSVKLKAIQYALCLFVGLACGVFLLIDLPVKWELSFLGLLGITVLMLVVGNVERILLFALSFTTPIYLAKAFINHPLSLPLSTGVGIGLQDILVLLLLIMYMGKLAFHQKLVHFSPVIPAAIAWTVLSALSLLVAIDSAGVIYRLIFMVKSILLCWMVATTMEDDVDLTFVIMGLLLGMAFQSFVGIYQGVTGRPLGLGFLTETTRVGQQMLGGGFANRVQGTMGHPNTLAMYLSTGVPFALALLFSKTKKYIKFLAVIALGMMGWAQILTLSRAAWGNFVASICIILVLAVWRKRMNTVLAVVIAGIAALAILGVSLFGTNLILSRLTFTDFGSAQSRITLAESAFKIINDSPVIGIGLNNYSLVSHKYDLVNLKAWGNRAPIVHNAFLLIAAETGVMGLAGFVIFIGTILVLAWQITKHATSNIMWVAGAGILGAMAALIVHNMVDYALLGNGRVFTQLWVLAGMAAALSLRIDSERRNASHAEVPSSTLSDELHSN